MADGVKQGVKDTKNEAGRKVERAGRKVQG